MFWKTITVGDHSRALITRRGRFAAILGPGTHRFFGVPSRIGVQDFGVLSLVFDSGWADFLVKERPAVVAEHFTVVETSDTEVAVISVDGKVHSILGPGKRVLFWKALSAVTFERIDFSVNPEVPAERLTAFERLPREAKILRSVVEEGMVGLLFIDSRLVRTLKPGNYAFWAFAGAPRVEPVDLRRQNMEILAQEILTRDKVSLRVNILAEYQVVDAVKARQSVKNYYEQLRFALQLAVRQTLGKRTLEEVLAEKTDIDEGIAAEVRAEMETIGVRVGAIALKDIVLPGEMREILNRVVAAEKEAQANLIRRREETAATRSLLNTAKLMEDNPVLVRLKELETLEKLVGKVEHLTVSGGFEGFLENLLSKKTGK